MLKTAPLRKSFLRLFDLARAFNFVNTPSSSDMDRTVRNLREVQGSVRIRAECLRPVAAGATPDTTGTLCDTAPGA